MSASASIERPFRFGVVVGGPQVADRWTPIARRLESDGFATMLVPDTLDGPAPLIAGAAAAGATDTLKVGTFVAVAGLRPPAVLAWEAETLQAISHGRFELGLGLGRPDADQDAERVGLRLGTVAERIGRLRMVLAAVRARPEPPAVLLAAGRPRMLQLAGQEADIVSLGLPPATPVPVLAEATTAVLRAAEDRPHPPELALNLLHAGDTDPPVWVRERMRLDRQALAGAAVALPGTPAQMAETLLRRRAETGISYVTGGLHLVDELAPVVELLSGR